MRFAVAAPAITEQTDEPRCFIVILRVRADQGREGGIQVAHKRRAACAALREIGMSSISHRYVTDPDQDIHPARRFERTRSRDWCDTRDISLDIGSPPFIEYPWMSIQ